MDLGPTRTDFYLGTPRFEIPSHSLQMITAPVILRLQTQSKDEVTFKQTTTTLLKSFGVAQRVTTQQTVINMYQNDTRKAHK